MIRNNLYKILFSLFLTLSLSASVKGQGLVERYVRGVENVETNLHFIYQGTYIPVLDITYHEFSADSITWRKEYEDGDCYIRFNNFTDNSTNPYNGLTGYHPDSTWWVFNFCTCNGAIPDEFSSIDTLFIDYGDGIDTVVITSPTVDIDIPVPDTVSGSSTNFQSDSIHTHELYVFIGDNEDVDTTGVKDGYVLKYNAVTGLWQPYPDLVGGGGSSLTVTEEDDDPDVSNVTEIRVTNGHLTNNGAGSVSLDLSIDPETGGNDFYRTGKVRVPSGDNFIPFSAALPDTDYVVASVYALLDIQNTRQNLKYDSITVNGFKVLSVVDSAYVHYIAIRDLDSLLLALNGVGYVYASGSDTILGTLATKVDDSTITVTNNELTVLSASYADSIYEDNVYLNSLSGGGETLYDLHSHSGVPHISSGAVVTDLGNDSISITAGIAYMKTANDDGANMHAVSVSADTLFIPDDLNYTVYIDYNSGSPLYKVKQATAGYFYQNWDELIFATVVNTTTSIKIRNFKDESINSVYKILLGQANYEPVRYLGGLEVVDQTTRQFSVGAGAVLIGNTYTMISAINTAVTDTFVRMYYDGSWQRVIGESTVNNTQYNDTASGAVSLSTGFYTIKWLYYVDDNPSYWVVLDGQSQYGDYSSAASVSKPSFLPPELSAFYAGNLLVGKFIMQQGKTEFVGLQSPFDDDYADRPETATKSYSFTSQGVTAGTFYTAGFYNISTVDANLTQASTTQSFGTSNGSHASHPFVVAGGAGTVDAGVVGLRVTGTKITDNGTRTTSYADTIITDITAQTLNQYTEADKFIGTVVYELIVMSGSPTTYSFDFNYGFAKYEDFGNNNFDVTGFETVGVAGATDANFNITLIHHNDDDWTYAASGFAITPTVITDLETVHSTESSLINGKPFAFKRVPLNYSEIINGSDSEGVIVRIVTTANNSVQSLNTHIGVRIIE